jgi:hypothetical protein
MELVASVAEAIGIGFVVYRIHYSTVICLIWFKIHLLFSTVKAIKNNNKYDCKLNTHKIE